MKRKLLFTRGDRTDTIDSLIEFLNKAKAEGATHYEMEWSKDPQWAFKWFNTFYIPSEKQLKEEKRAKLEKELEELKP